MRREEFPVGRPDWENVIIEEGLTYSVDGPHDTDHYWNEYAAYIFSPQEMDSVRAQAEEMHRMCLETVEYIASGAFGTLGLPQAAFNLAVESWNRRDADFYGRFDFTYSGVPGDPMKLLEYNADTPTGIVEAAVSQKTWAKDQRLDTRGYVHWGEIGEAFTNRWRHIFAPEITAGVQPVLYLAHVPSEIDENNEDYNNLWLIAYSAQQAGIKTHMIPIDEIIFNDETKSWEDAYGRAITNLFKLYPWEDLVTDSEAGYDKLLFAYHGAMDRWIEPAWKMFLSNKLLLAALWDKYPGHPNLVPTYAGHRGGMRNWVRKPIFGREGDGVEIYAPDYDVFIKPEDDDFFANAPRKRIHLPGVHPGTALRRHYQPGQPPHPRRVGGRRTHRRRGHPRIERCAHRLLVPLRPTPSGSERLHRHGIRRHRPRHRKLRIAFRRHSPQKTRKYSEALASAKAEARASSIEFLF